MLLCFEYCRSETHQPRFFLVFIVPFVLFPERLLLIGVFVLSTTMNFLTFAFDLLVHSFE